MLAETVHVVPDPLNPSRPWLEFQPTDDDFGCVIGFLGLHSKKGLQVLRLEEFPHTERGYGIHLTKLMGGTDPEEGAYDVFVCARTGRAECSCKGFTRWQACKHATAVETCRAQGWF